MNDILFEVVDRINKYIELNWFENVYDHHHEKNIQWANKR